MNTRQKKKWDKIIKQRIHLVNSHTIISSGMRSGKTQYMKSISKIIYTKQYKPFEELKNRYSKLFIAIDLSIGKDFSVMNTYRRENGKITVIKSEIIE